MNDPLKMKSGFALLPGLEEVFRTENGCIYQSDLENCYYIAFADKTVKFKLKCLFRLKSILDQIDLARMASDVRRAADVEIISLCACEQCYVLTLTQIIAFRELLDGAKVMLELNSIIHERLRRVPVSPF
jgi:transcriptional antiterminator Rof (Rho-off)